MMENGLVIASYIAASILFILSLSGLSHQETAKRGNFYGIAAMIMAIVATLLSGNVGHIGLIITVIMIGIGLGLILARRIEMTSMPQLVAILHSSVGMGAVLIGFASYLDPATEQIQGVEATIHHVEVALGVFIGAITFTGSMVAFGKLQGLLSSQGLQLSGRHLINSTLVIVSMLLGWFVLGADSSSTGVIFLLLMTLLAFIFGAHLVMAIGGADMPVVISMLNSYSGWAAAAAGFMLSNDLLIVIGALVGSSGAILSYIMCEAMNRSFLSVILGGLDKAKPVVNDSSGAPVGEVQAITPEATAQLLKASKNIVIVPGYGMAVANAQHPIAELVRRLDQQKIQVRFAIHPVAGRMPGHMNVLLAEAKVPYDIVYEMDEINPELANVDVVMVVGANDIVNPDAIDSEDSPIAGMPVIEAWNAKQVIVSKRSMGTGYAGVENPLFYRDNTQMLFGDAKESIESLLKAM